MFFSFQDDIKFINYKHYSHQKKVPPQVVPRCDSTFLNPFKEGFKE